MRLRRAGRSPWRPMGERSARLLRWNAQHEHAQQYIPLLVAHAPQRRGDQGFTRALTMFSYPLSANDVETDAILAAKGVPMARSGWAWQIHPNEYNSGPKLLGHGATNMGGKTLTAVKQLVDAAVYYGTTVSVFTHGIVAGGDGTTPPADPLYWYQNDFQALVDYLVAYREQGILDIDSPTQWLTKRTLP